MTYHSKYTRAYRDDILYLIDLRDSHLTHPKKTVVTSLFTPSFARLFCIAMIGEIEATFNAWKEKDENQILAPFWQSGTNESRVNALEENFKENGIEVNREILDYYLAIKYTRNIITHSEDPKPASETAPHIIAMGFPIDPRTLTEKHLAIMYKVNKEMLRYVTAVEKDEFNEERYKDYFTQKDLPQTSKYFEERDFRGFLWHNIENMVESIKTSSLSDSSFLKAAFFSWITYKNMALVGIIDFENLPKNITRLQKLVELPNGKDFPYWGMTKTDSPQMEKMLQRFEKKIGIPKDKIPQYAQALAQAKICNDRIKNGCAASLLKKISQADFAPNLLNFKKESEIATQTFEMLKLWEKFK